MSNEQYTTTDHDVVKYWVEIRDGYPAAVKDTMQNGDVGIIRIDFPGYEGENDLVKISWDDFFQKFEAEKLAFIYQEETADGERSYFNKLISRDQ